MNHTLLISALLATLSLAACDRPTVVNVPATPVAVPGPAGPQGEAGSPRQSQIRNPQSAIRNAF